MKYPEYEEKYGMKHVPEWEVDYKTNYVMYCDNASVIVYLYSAMCLLPKFYTEGVDNSRDGYMLWLYAGSRALDHYTVNVLNVALEDRGIDIRARVESSIAAPALGRRTFLGNRHVLRLERPGLRDLIGEGNYDIGEYIYRSAAAYMPKLAQWHMSYVDVDDTYDLAYKQKEADGNLVTCYVKQGKETTFMLLNPR